MGRGVGADVTGVGADGVGDGIGGDVGGTGVGCAVGSVDGEIGRASCRERV